MIKNLDLKSQNSNLNSSDAKVKRAQSMAELMSSFSSKMQPLKKGDIVEGTVKKLDPHEITLDIGAKSDALVLEYDKTNIDNLLNILKLGDKVRATVLFPESEDGFPIVSLRRTLDDLIFLRLEEIFKNSEVMEIYVSEMTKGGYFTETEEGIRGFLPNSQVLAENNLVNKKLQVKIIEFDRTKKRLIFSEKATLYLTSPTEIEKQIKRDEIVTVKVTNVTNHGIYVSYTTESKTLIEGFVHISEVSYQRVEDLRNMFKKGQELKVQVLDIDRDNRRVNFSIKKLEKDTFEDVKVKYQKDQKVKGKVKDVRSKGITVELEENVLGFIPEAKVPTDTTYKTGEEIDALVEGFDVKRRMVTLTPVLKAKPIAYR